MVKGTDMTDSSDDRMLHRLLAWFSPGFPIGAFTYSHGLETVVEDGTVVDLDSLAAWITDILRLGAGRADGIILRRAWMNEENLRELNDLAIAMAPTRERRLETVAQGVAFVKVASEAWSSQVWFGTFDLNSSEIAYPVAVGCVARAHGLKLRPVLYGYLHSLAANLISAGVRLIPLGQTDGQRALNHLEPVIGEVTDDILMSDIDDLGGIAFAADIASARHETLYTRLFRS